MNLDLILSNVSLQDVLELLPSEDFLISLIELCNIETMHNVAPHICLQDFVMFTKPRVLKYYIDRYRTLPSFLHIAEHNFYAIAIKDSGYEEFDYDIMVDGWGLKHIDNELSSFAKRWSLDEKGIGNFNFKKS